MGNASYGILFVLSGISSLFIASYVWGRRTIPETFWFSLLMFAAAVWAFICAFETAASDLAVKVMWGRVSYTAVVNVAPVWFVYALSQGKSLRAATRKYLPVLWIVPVLIFIASATNDRHGLLWTGTRLVETSAGLQVQYSYGPAFLFNAVYAYGLVLTGTMFLVFVCLRGKNRQMGFLLAAAAVFPWIFNILYILGRNPPGIDLTPAALAAAGHVLFWPFIRIRILEIAPFARHLLFREMSDAFLVIDNRGILMDLNPAAERSLGISSECLGRPAVEFLRRWPEIPEHCGPAEDGEGTVSLETSSGETWFDVRITPIRGSSEQVRGKLFVFRDVSSRKNLESELVLYATLDTLTGVYNRRMGLTIFEQQLRFSERNGTHLTICFVDINDLKSVNDNYGHAEGDFVIRRIAGTLKEALRESDILCRLGGDEFLLILPDCTLEHAEAVLKRVEEKLDDFRMSDAKPYSFDAAKGFAEYIPGSGLTTDELLSRADADMYRNKERMKGLGGRDAGPVAY